MSGSGFTVGFRFGKRCRLRILTSVRGAGAGVKAMALVARFLLSEHATGGSMLCVNGCEWKHHHHTRIARAYRVPPGFSAKKKPVPSSLFPSPFLPPLRPLVCRLPKTMPVTWQHMGVSKKRATMRLWAFIPPRSFCSLCQIPPLTCCAVGSVVLGTEEGLGLRD